MKSFKFTFAYFVNPFIYDIIEDGFQICEIILSEKEAGELELLEMKEASQMLHEASSMIEFWKLVPESKYLDLKKAACYFQFLVQHIAMNLYTL